MADGKEKRQHISGRASMLPKLAGARYIQEIIELNLWQEKEGCASCHTSMFPKACMASQNHRTLS